MVPTLAFEPAARELSTRLIQALERDKPPLIRDTEA